MEMLYTAFIFGLISSFHCVGMCGPIAFMLPVDRSNSLKKVFQVFTYHFGRLTAYSTIGILFGLLGRGFFMAGIQQRLSIFLGICMIVIVLVPQKIFAKYNFFSPVYKLTSRIRTVLGKHFKKTSYKSLFMVGLLNGFLPCGMVYVALFGAIAMQSIITGGFYMILFGLGTIPLMSCVIYIQSFLTVSVRNMIQKAIPFVTIVIGILFILKGLGLGVPYVSPSNISLSVKQQPNCH